MPEGANKVIKAGGISFSDEKDSFCQQPQPSRRAHELSVRHLTNTTNFLELVLVPFMVYNEPDNEAHIELSFHPRRQVFTRRA